MKYTTPLPSTEIRAALEIAERDLAALAALLRPVATTTDLTHAPTALHYGLLRLHAKVREALQ